MSDKKYINLHAEIDESGMLNLVDNDGRILAGVRSKSIHTAHEELSYAHVEIILKGGDDMGLTRSKVKAPSCEPFSREQVKHLVDEINKVLE